MIRLISIVGLLFYCTVSLALNKFVVFGDSLSDNGNLYEYMKHQLPLSPPYYKGRFTNGPVWIELLVASYYPQNPDAHLLDYAFGGAGIMEGDDADDDFFTLNREMDSYFLAHQDKADENAMYVLWIGANNYLALPDNWDKTLHEVTAGIDKGLQQLVNKGAKHILVVNVPSLGKIPVARDFDAEEMLTYLASHHNEWIKNKFAEYQKNYPEIEWFFFDVDQLFTDIMANPSAFGLTNLTDTCYEQMATGRKQSVLKLVANVKPKAEPDACTGFLFFDPVHPAKDAHRFMAELTRAMFDKRGVIFN